MVSITFEGQSLQARATDTVAAALMASGITTTRLTPVSNSPRGPFCMMGVCFDCLADIDGVANRQTCMVRVKDGMTVKRMEGARVLATEPDTAQTKPDSNVHEFVPAVSSEQDDNPGSST